jgi:hypothetical protein
LERLAPETGVQELFPWILTFECLLSETAFVKTMRDMLTTLQDAYGSPVDTEFTANFFGKDSYKINLLQCRPMQVSDGRDIANPPEHIAEKRLIFDAHGGVVGQSRIGTIDRIIYVVPSVYGQLPINRRYSVARLIGRLMHLEDGDQPRQIMIMGPGRWGTTTPALGVPVSFAEINRVSVLCEIVSMREGLVPDVSLGTHFFNELVEADMLYVALFPGRQSNRLNEEFFGQSPNKLRDLIPDAAGHLDVVRVIDAADLTDGRIITLNASNRNQRVVCYLSREEEMPETL